MVNDVAGRVDFMMPALATFTVALDAPLEQGAARPVMVKASLTYVWFKPPSSAAQNRMQQAIIRRIESSSPDQKKRILDHDIPALMAAKNTMESAHSPVTMATASAAVD